MSNENSVFLEQENKSNALLNDILVKLNHIPNTTHVVNSINRLNKVAVTMVGAKSPATGYSVQSNGIEGFVPAPKVTDSDKFLRGDGTWQSVVVSIDPLKTAELKYSDTNVNAKAYPYVQPSEDTSGYAGTLKYNKSLSFSRSQQDIFGEGVLRVYETLDLSKGSTSLVSDIGITFKPASGDAISHSSTLLSNISELKSDTYAKMPTISGTLLTDGGFTVNGPVIANNSVTIGSYTTMNAPLRINPNPGWGPWNQGIRIQSAPDGHALIGLGVSSSASQTNDSWFIRSDKTSGSNIFSIAYGGTLGSINGSLWTNTDGNWYLSNGLTASMYLNIGSNYSMHTSGNTVVHSSSLSTVVFTAQGQQVNLLDSDKKSLFYINELCIEPLEATYDAENMEGGQIQLSARRGNNYGSVFIDNYNGRARVWNSKTDKRLLEVEFNTNHNSDDPGTIKASTFSAIVHSLMSSSGIVHLTSASNNINIHTHEAGGNHPHVEISVPMTTNASSTYTGTDERYYRPITISNTAPSQNDGRDGDVWITYV